MCINHLYMMEKSADALDFFAIMMHQCLLLIQVSLKNKNNLKNFQSHFLQYHNCLKNTDDEEPPNQVIYLYANPKWTLNLRMEWYKPSLALSERCWLNQCNQHDCLTTVYMISTCKYTHMLICICAGEGAWYFTAISFFIECSSYTQTVS